MKNYTITVNGTVYQVTVEEGINTESIQTKTSVAPVQKVVPVTKPSVPAAPTSIGEIKVNAPMPGKILGVKASIGDHVKRGDVILILEAMKMENEVVAPNDGTVFSIHVAVGDSVEAGDVLATLN